MTEKQRHRLFLSLYSKCQARVYAFILMLVHNNHDADEIFQDTSVLLWEKFDQYEEGTNFGAWAVSIAKYQVFGHLRKKKKNELTFGFDMMKSIANIAEFESSKIDTRIKLLEICLNKLDHVGRSLLLLRYQQNMPVKKIAQRKGVSSGVIYRKLSKLFDALRRCVNLSVSHQS